MSRIFSKSKFFICIWKTILHKALLVQEKTTQHIPYLLCKLSYKYRSLIRLPYFCRTFHCLVALFNRNVSHQSVPPSTILGAWLCPIDQKFSGVFVISKFSVSSTELFHPVYFVEVRHWNVSWISYIRFNWSPFNVFLTFQIYLSL